VRASRPVYIPKSVQVTSYGPTTIDDITAHHITLQHEARATTSRFGQTGEGGRKGVLIHLTRAPGV
jgi:hypothetical protein